jgi:hypothetical protein
MMRLDKLAYMKGAAEALKKYKMPLNKPAEVVRARDLVGWKEKSVTPSKLGNGSGSV